MTIGYDEFKKRFPKLTAEMSAEQVACLVDAAEPREIKAGTELITYGKPSDALYLLWEGRLSIVIDADGKRLVLAEIGPGRWVGEISWIDPGPASATVLAETDSTLMALSRDCLSRLCKDKASVTSLLFQVISLDLADRLRATSTHLLRRVSDTEYRLERPESGSHKWLLDVGKKLMGAGGEAR